MKNLPKELEELINETAKNDIPMIGKDLEKYGQLCMKIIAQKILFLPTECGLAPTEVVTIKKKWYGRVGYDNEGIVREHEFETEKEADAYVNGALAVMGIACQEDDNPLEDYWAVYSDLESIEEGASNEKEI